jgi:hypothetical protein
MHLLATSFVDNAGYREVSDAAVRALEAGLDTPMLYQLAGLTEWTGSSELDVMFRRLLAELGAEMPEHRELVRTLARPLARDFLAGRLTPGAFVDGLYALSMKDRRDAEHHPWCELQDRWQLANDGFEEGVAAVEADLREEAQALVGSGP